MKQCIIVLVIISATYPLHSMHSNCYTSNLQFDSSKIIRQFRNSIDINATLSTFGKGDNEISKLTPLMLLILQINAKPTGPAELDRFNAHTFPLFILVLTDFYDKINTKIKNSHNQTIFDMCIIDTNDSNWCKENKRHCLVLLNNYLTKKPNFTERKQEVLYNCHFSFVDTGLGKK